MTDVSRSVLLRFDPDTDDAAGEDRLRGHISAVVQAEGHLWVASDESNSVERFSRTEPGVYAKHRTFRLADYLALPGGEDDEIDIEGLDYDGGYIWVVGSHSLRRRKADSKEKVAKRIRRLGELRAAGNRYLFARIPLAPDKAGECTLRERVGVAKKPVRMAARLMGGDRGNVLTDALRLDEHLGPFLSIPSKDNGFDVEGLAVRGNRAFLGLRGPVLGGWAVVIEILLEDIAPGFIRLAAIDDDGRQYRKHFLDLRGLGLRDLCFHGSDLLVLAGPTMDLNGPAATCRWAGALDATGEALLARTELPEVVEVPYRTGTKNVNDRPEGLTLYSDDKESTALLVVYDAGGMGRKPGEGDLRADVFPLK
ncbi:MAG: DUF3616 domain-containing protein [Gammaproteobacteria bacterium]